MVGGVVWRFVEATKQMILVAPPATLPISWAAAWWTRVIRVVLVMATYVGVAAIPTACWICWSRLARILARVGTLA